METNIKKSPVNVDFFEDLTGTITAVQQTQVQKLGQRIRAIREDKGLSLEDLSKFTGFTVEHLGDIEQNLIQPQLGTIMKLSKALDSAFSRLVSGVGDRLYSITRRDEQKVISRSSAPSAGRSVYTYKSLAPEVKGRHMEALIVQLEENPDKEMSVHTGEEFIYVLKGTAVLKIGADVFELAPGDSVYYLSTTPHLIASKAGQTTILAVLYQE